MRALWARSNTIIPYITLVITTLAVERAAARHQPFHREGRPRLRDSPEHDLQRQLRCGPLATSALGPNANPHHRTTWRVGTCVGSGLTPPTSFERLPNASRSGALTAIVTPSSYCAFPLTSEGAFGAAHSCKHVTTMGRDQRLPREEGMQQTEQGIPYGLCCAGMSEHLARALGCLW